MRWMSPERLDPVQFGIKGSGPTKESDCYALGMVILEVLTGQVPFTRDFNDLMVMNKVLEGERPGRPEGVERAWFTDDLWVTLQVCWSRQPNDRPTIDAVLECLTRASKTWQPLPPSVDDDPQMDSDESSSLIVSEGTLLTSVGLNFFLAQRRNEDLLYKISPSHKRRSPKAGDRTAAYPVRRFNSRTG